LEKATPFGFMLGKTFTHDSAPFVLLKTLISPAAKRISELDGD
jgi:hypothetical protein